MGCCYAGDPAPTQPGSFGDSKELFRMLTIHGGIDSYGRVKTVCGTPIVTRFVMVHGLPVYPIQSFYFTGQGPTETTGIPVIANLVWADVKGVPLAALDLTSVVMAYSRAFLAGLTVIGSFVIAIGILYLTNPKPLDDFQIGAVWVVLICLAVGSVGGLLTYALPVTPRRERDIRRHCGDVLGAAVDPARVPADVSALLVQFAAEQCPSDVVPPFPLILELINTRAKIAQGIDAEEMEAKTDDLLGLLGRHEQSLP